MRVLAINAGSSSLKLRLLDAAPGAPAAAGTALASGTIGRFGDEAQWTFEHGGQRRSGHEPIADHAAAVERALAWLGESARSIEAVGHRVVHGGARFTSPAVIDDGVVAAIEALEALAPLHNRPSLAGIRACRTALTAPMVAVFDTAFHAGLPPAAAQYAIPHALAQRHGIRRFGFHGLSYAWATGRAAALLGRPADQLRLVVLHLGNGASAAAIRGGVSIDTSMGLTPLEGLVMGTRSGDLDPAIIGYLVRAEHASVAEVEAWLNERSGLAGLGGSGDVRDLLAREATDADARLALDIFCHRARKYLGAYLAVLEGADAVIFTGGIGTHAPPLRRRIAAGLEWCGLHLDEARNAALSGDGAISTEGSAIRALVVEADEERIIAQQTVACLAGSPSGRTS